MHAATSVRAVAVSPCHSACSASSPRPMNALKFSAGQNGSSQVRRSATTASLPWATSMNSAMAERTASRSVVTRTGNPSATCSACSQSPSLKCAR